MSLFFIDRPVFAWVIAIAIMLGGGLALRSLSVSQYPQIAPTTVNISATYPGADAQTVENSVTKVIEQGMTGIDHLDYMTSNSSSTGQAQITLAFTNAADPDVAQMQVQNRLQLVTSRLPQVVQSTGLTVTKASSGFLMVIAFVSSDGRMQSTDIADYVSSSLNDTLRRVAGVGDTSVFGSGYAMRIWLDPDRLARYALMPSDVRTALEAQNTQVSAGQLGALPVRPGQQLTATVTAMSRLQTPEQFRAIILRSTGDGALVRLEDVATVELGAESYITSAAYNGRPAAGLAINLATGANAIDTAEAVRRTIERLSGSFPQGLVVEYPYDTTPFVQRSIEEVVKALCEAVALVVVVMFVFLRNLRATLIPTLAVPVVLLGTFGVLAIFGYSINTLTMFAMVLAIGLLVDDAIVVVENVERIMHEEGLAPREATRRSMGEITGALIGIAVVLSAVFVPMAFLGGSAGVIYRQFSVTIVTAMLLSVVIALVLTPALCATILKPPQHVAGSARASALRRLASRASGAYRGSVAGLIRRPRRFVAGFVVILVACGALYVRLPSSFLPQEDQGVLMTMVQLPAGATQDRTLRVLDAVREHYLTAERDTVDGVFTSAGFGFGGQGQNVGIAFVRLKPFDARRSPEQSALAIAMRAMRAFQVIRDARVFALLPPAIPGLGNTGGFSFYLQDINGAGRDRLIAARDQLLAAAAASPRLSTTRPSAREDEPQFAIDIDQERAGALGVAVADINSTLSLAWGGSYVNDFIDRGRVKRVHVQADRAFRMQPEDLERWHVRNASGGMVPFSAFATGRWVIGSPRLERFNGVAAIQIEGDAARGVSSGHAMLEVERLMGQLPGGFSHEWTGISYQERLSGNQAAMLYAVSALVVFLSLAALYESVTVPFAVMLTVPVGVLGAIGAALLLGQTNDVYFKVGLLTTIGLAAKNAILIAEFAVQREASGEDVVTATLEAAKLRLRPILMTSIAFMLGVAPLAVATGAGSGAQNAIGIGVMGGMIAATVLGVFVAPPLFVLVRRLRGAGAGRGREAGSGAAPEQA